MSIQRLDIQILVENSSGTKGTLGESGFSAFAEVVFTDLTQYKLLFDTGPSSVAFLNNIKRLNVDLTTIDAIVLSHGHWDHVGGLKKAISLTKKRIPVICHPQALLPKTILDKGKIVDIGIQSFIKSLDELKKEADLINTTSSHRLNESIMTTGEVPRKNEFEKLSGKLKEVKTQKDGKEIPDKIEDDLSLIFHLANDSIVILAGCCHSGIINTVNFTTESTGSNDIVGIIGGLHLFDASNERLSRTTRELQKYPIEIIAPCHCTGLQGKFVLSTAFGKKFYNTIVSTKLKFESS